MLRRRILGATVSVVGRSAAFAQLVRMLEAIDPLTPGILGVLTYHRVDEPGRDPGLYPGLLSASPTEFEEQLGFLVRRFRLLSAEELLDIRDSHRRLPPRSLMITVDDAYRDFGEYAWPIARRHGAPMTLFVPTAYCDGTMPAFWWDRLHAALQAARPTTVDTGSIRLDLSTAARRRAAFNVLHARVRSLPHDEGMQLVDHVVMHLDAPNHPNQTLSWAELRQLAAEGVTLAAHSRTHPRLDRVDLDRVAAEISGSMNDLRQRIGSILPVFAYPSGHYDETTIEVAAAAGIRIAFTTRRGVNDLRRADWLALRRINVGARSTLPILRAQLLASLAPVSDR